MSEFYTGPLEVGAAFEDGDAHDPGARRVLLGGLARDVATGADTRVVMALTPEDAEDLIAGLCAMRIACLAYSR